MRLIAPSPEKEIRNAVRSLFHMVPWPSGKAKVCKTFIPQFKSGRYLQKVRVSLGDADFFHGALHGHMGRFCVLRAVCFAAPISAAVKTRMMSSPVYSAVLYGFGRRRSQPYSLFSRNRLAALGAENSARKSRLLRSGTEK